MWSLFFPGYDRARESDDDDLTAQEYEKVFEFLYEISKVAPFEVKTTEGLHYRRYIAQRLKAEHGGRGGANGRMLWRTTGVSDGRGFVFVSHTGEIYPSGFLPISGGNVRTDSLVDVYQNSSLFRILRDASAREGKCGYCEYHKLCGGSRARAYAMTGNYLEADPRCCYTSPNARSMLVHRLSQTVQFIRQNTSDLGYVGFLDKGEVIAGYLMEDEASGRQVVPSEGGVEIAAVRPDRCTRHAPCVLTMARADGAAMRAWSRAAAARAVSRSWPGNAST